MESSLTKLLFLVGLLRGATAMNMYLSPASITVPAITYYQEVYYTFTFTASVGAASGTLAVNFAKNFDIVAFYSDASPPSARYSQLSFLAKQVTLNAGDTCLPIHGFNSSSPVIPFGGSVSIKLAQQDCSSSRYICIEIQPYQGSYIDSNSTNDHFCTPVTFTCSDCAGCNPDMKMLGFSLPGFAGPLYTRSYQTIPFSVTLHNIGNVTINDNLQKNFEFQAGFYNADRSLNPGATLLSPLSLSSTAGLFTFVQNCAEARKMIRLDSSSTTFTGTLSVALPEANCNATTHLCLEVAPYHYAYHDMDNSNNYVCVNVQNVKASNCKPCCIPDITIDSTLSTVTTDPVLYATFLHSYEFTLIIKNVGIGDVVQNFSNNFDVLAQFYADDLKVNSVAEALLSASSISTGGVTLDDPCDAKSGLSNSSTQTLTLTGSFRGSFDAVTCKKVKYVCFTVNPYDNAYEDYADPNNLLNNVLCFSIASAISATCEDRPSQDVDFSNLRLSISGKYIYVDTEQTLYLSMDLQTSGNRTVSVDLVNGFVYSAFYSTGDVRNSQPYEMTGCGAGQVRGFQVTKSGVYMLQPLRKNTVISTGKAKLRLPNLLCTSARYLCVSMIPNGLTFTDTNNTNNVYCLDVSELLRCGKRYHPNERGCRTNDDCVEFAACESEYCKCQGDFAPAGDGTVCLRTEGSICFDDYDCITNSYCSADKRCTCQTGYLSSSDKAKCGNDLGTSCRSDADCRTRWGMCDTTTLRCVCPLGYSMDSKKTCVRKKLFLPCTDDSDCGVLASVCDPQTKKCNCSVESIQDAQTCRAKVGGECGTTADCYYPQSGCQANPNVTSTIRAVCLCVDQHCPDDKLRKCVFSSLPCAAPSERALLHSMLVALLFVYLLI